MPKNQPASSANSKVTFEDESGAVPKVIADESALYAVPVDTIPFDVVLPCSIYVKVANKFVLFREQGETLTARRALELQKFGATALYIHPYFWNTFLKALEEMNLPEPVSPLEKTLHIRHVIIAYGKELERAQKENRGPVFEKLRHLATSLAAALEGDPQLAERVVRHSDMPGLYFLNHLVNTAVYANLISRKLKYSAAQRKLLTHAVLVHDAGNVYLSRHILLKPGGLSSEERKELTEHPRQGAELLIGLGEPADVVQTALQHHERMDGQGYPQGLKGEQIHPFARICAIADVFDALTSNRPYRNALTPAEALKTMAEMKGFFDPSILANIGKGA